MTVPAGTVPFRGEPLPQHTSSSYWQKDCVPASSALCVNGTSVDVLRPTPWNIRQAAGVLEYRGMSYGEAVMGVVTWTGKQGRRITPTVRYSVTRADFKAFVDGGRRCVISISCYVTVRTKRATNDYTGNHSMSVHDYRWAATTCMCELKGTTAAGTDHGEYLVEDPGTTTTGYQWWSAALLFKAAEFRTGGDGIDCIVFPDTEGVTRTGVGGYFYDSAFRSSTRKQAIGTGPYTVTNTTNGGGWQRPDGSTGYGWYRVPGDLYAPGKDLR
jgi:hypothetical protein